MLRRFVDVAADATKDRSNLFRLLNVLQEGSRVRTIAAVAVISRAAGLRCVGDNHALRSINLGYDIPSAMLKKAGITSLRIYVNATNPFILYSPFVKAGLGIDPEGNGYGAAVSAAGSDVGVPTRQISVNLNNPPTRQYLIGINARF